MTLDDVMISLDDIISLKGDAVSNMDMEVVFATAGTVGVGVKYVNYYLIDTVHTEIVTLICNDQETFGNDYRYGFNNQEKDNEVAGIGNSNTAMFWQYDTRLGRRWNIDPVDQIGISNYATFGDNPILNVDVNGDLFFGLFGSNSKQRKSARAYAKENNGKVNDLLSKDINVTSWTTNNYTDGGYVVISASKVTTYFGRDGGPQDYSMTDVDNIMDVLRYQETIEEWTRLGIWDPTLTREEARKNIINNGLMAITPSTPNSVGTSLKLVRDGAAARSSNYVNLANRSRTAHIIAGDATGGGHAWFGSTKSLMNGLTGKKSMFPATWSNSKIMNGVSEVVTSNSWVQQTGRAGAIFTRSGQPVRFVTEGYYNGLKIRVINTHSEIITAFPIK